MATDCSNIGAESNPTRTGDLVATDANWQSLAKRKVEHLGISNRMMNSMVKDYRECIRPSVDYSTTSPPSSCNIFLELKGADIVYLTDKRDRRKS